MIQLNRALRILHVEDDPDAARLFARWLAWFRPVTLDVVQASDLKTALELLERDSFDALLLDLRLPDGEEWSTLAVAGEVARWLPVVVLTGNDDTDLASLAGRLGVQSYLAKERQDGLSVGAALVDAFERHHASRSALVPSAALG